MSDKKSELGNVGYFLPGKTSLQAIKAFIADFLADRSSPSPFPEPSVLGTDGKLDWGASPILKRIVDSEEGLERQISDPEFLKNAVTIIEPWENVGDNPQKEPVRASINVAYIGQKVADLDSILLPAWKGLRFAPMDRIADLAARCMAYVLEGGAPAVYDESTFTHPECSRAELLDLTQRLLLSRMNHGAAGIFVCLGHQLACTAHILLLERAVKEILATDRLDGDASGVALASLKALANRISSVGDAATVILQDGTEVASGWRAAQFATTRNVVTELSGHDLTPYVVPAATALNVPDEVIETYEATAQHDGIIDLIQNYSGLLKVDMFHGDISTEQATLFASWAYTKLHIKLVAYRSIIARSPVSWLLNLPYAVKILASTRSPNEQITANAATCIFYKDFDSGRLFRSFTTQFHPELTDDLRDFDHRMPPTYSQIKQNAGHRILVHLLQSATRYG